VSKEILEVKSASKAAYPNEYIFGAEGFVADFDLLYREIEDPWEQTSSFNLGDSRRLLALNYCERLFPEGEHQSSAKILEIGCGFGHLTEGLRVSGFNSTGVDISRVAIEKASATHPEATFLERDISDARLLEEIDPDIIIMSEVT
jgi:SAM-dependent methyltransferase